MSQNLIPNPKQQAFFDAVLMTNKNIVLKSTAGSGKTTTAVMAHKYIPLGKKTLFTAFNKHIADELQSRLPSTVDCSTMHSLGMKAIRGHFPKDRLIIKENKQINFIKRIVEEKKTHKDVRKQWAQTIVTDKIVRLIRTGISIN